MVGLFFKAVGDFGGDLEFGFPFFSVTCIIVYMVKVVNG